MTATTPRTWSRRAICAFRSFAGFRGGDGRAWFLAIVRNAGLTWLDRNRSPRPTVPFDEALHGRSRDDAKPPFGSNSLQQTLNDLPPEFREAIVLREMEGLSYKEVAAVTGAPIGTVMSRLSRGRQLLRQKIAIREAEPS